MHPTRRYISIELNWTYVHKKTPKNTRDRHGNASTLHNSLYFSCTYSLGMVVLQPFIRIYLWHVQIKETFNYLKMFSCVLIKWSLTLLQIGCRCTVCLHTHCKYNLNVCSWKYSRRRKFGKHFGESDIFWANQQGKKTVFVAVDAAPFLLKTLRKLNQKSSHINLLGPFHWLALAWTSKIWCPALYTKACAANILFAIKHNFQRKAAFYLFPLFFSHFLCCRALYAISFVVRTEKKPLKMKLWACVLPFVVAPLFLSLSSSFLSIPSSAFEIAFIHTPVHRSFIFLCSFEFFCCCFFLQY